MKGKPEIQFTTFNIFSLVSNKIIGFKLCVEATPPQPSQFGQIKTPFSDKCIVHMELQFREKSKIGEEILTLV